MYCIFVFNNTGITKCESINTKDYDDFASATNTLDKIVAVDTCFAMVRDAMNELVKYHEGDNCRKNTEGIWKDLFKAERKVRSVLFEIRAYHEHMINVLSKTKRKKYAHEVENAKNSDPLFAFVWELRNYVTHFHKVVDHFDDDKNGNSHPFPDVAELLNLSRRGRFCLTLVPSPKGNVVNFEHNPNRSRAKGIPKPSPDGEGGTTKP